jgi:hypothetical protein
MGELDLYLIYQYGEDWEDEWKPLQGLEITEIFSVVTKEIADFALKGWAKPLVRSLGMAPIGAIRRIPNVDCYQKEHCPFYDRKSCMPTHKKLPNCYVPGNIESSEARILASEVVRMWRAGVTIVVVKHDLESGG